MKTRKGDAADKARCTIRFESKEVREGLGFAECPRFQAVDVEVKRRYHATIEQKKVRVTVDIHGNRSDTKTITAVETETCTHADLMSTLSLESPAFFEHAWVAHHQAEMFDHCVDNLPMNSIAILLDFSMVRTFCKI